MPWSLSDRKGKDGPAKEDSTSKGTKVESESIAIYQLLLPL